MWVLTIKEDGYRDTDGLFLSNPNVKNTHGFQLPLLKYISQP